MSLNPSLAGGKDSYMDVYAKKQVCFVICLLINSDTDNLNEHQVIVLVLLSCVFILSDFSYSTILVITAG